MQIVKNALTAWSVALSHTLAVKNFQSPRENRTRVLRAFGAQSRRIRALINGVYVLHEYGSRRLLRATLRARNVGKPGISTSRNDNDFLGH